MQARNQNNESPTMYAIKRNMTYVAEVFIGLDNDLDYVVPATRKTALMYVATRNHINVVKSLQERAADLSIQDVNGDKALHHAATLGYRDIYEELTRCGAEVNIQNNNHKTAFMLGNVHNMPDPQEVLDVHDLVCQFQGLNIAILGDQDQEHAHQLEVSGHQQDGLDLFGQ